MAKKMSKSEEAIRSSMRATKRAISQTEALRKAAGEKPSNLEKARKWMYDIPEDYKRYPGESYSGSKVGRGIARGIYYAIPIVGPAALLKDTSSATVRAAKDVFKKRKK